MTRTTYKHVRRDAQTGVPLFSILRSNMLPSLLFAAVILGIVVGVLNSVSLTKDTYEGIQFLTGAHLDLRSQNGFTGVFFSSFSSSFVLLLLVFVFGFCAIGSPFILFFLFIQGLGFGLSSGYFYSTMGGQGFLYTLALVLPGMFISLLTMIFAAEHAQKLSMHFFACIFDSGKQEKLSQECHRYCAKFVLCILVLLLKAVIEGFITILFIGFF